MFRHGDVGIDICEGFWTAWKGLGLRQFVHTNLPKAGFELWSLWLQAGVLPIEPICLWDNHSMSLDACKNTSKCCLNCCRSNEQLHCKPFPILRWPKPFCVLEATIGEFLEFMLLASNEKRPCLNWNSNSFKNYEYHK